MAQKEDLKRNIQPKIKLEDFWDFMSVMGLSTEEIMEMKPEEMRNWMSLFVTDEWLFSGIPVGMNKHEKENCVTQLTKDFWNNKLERVKKHYKEAKKNGRINSRTT